MSKLNRREFKELLTEWKQNFINERTVNTNLVDFKGLTPTQKDYVKKVPIDLNLYAIGDFSISEHTFGSFMHDVMSRSKSVYKTYESSIILHKNSIIEILEILDLVFNDLLNKENLFYKDTSMNNVKVEEKKQNIKAQIAQSKRDLQRLASDNVGLMIYFPRMINMVDEMASGSINNILNISDQKVWKSHLQWELKHDVFHYFEDILDKESFMPYIELRDLFRDKKNLNMIIRKFVVEGADGGKSDDGLTRLGSSVGDGDNFASVAHHIRSLPNNEKGIEAFLDQCLNITSEISQEDIEYLKLFFSKIHMCYNFIGSFLKDRILLQTYSHG